MAWSSERLIAVLLGMVSGCGLKSPDPNTLPSLNPDPHPNMGLNPTPCPEADEPNCQGILCGNRNSPFTNLFPINGVSTNGICNKDGIQLIPGSLTGGGCSPGSTLDFDPKEQRLIGRRSLGSGSPCEHEGLIGATFVVKSARRTLHLKIAKVEHFDENGPHEGYLIVDATDSKKRSLCQFDVARDALHRLGLKKQDPDEPAIIPDGFRPAEYDGLVVAMPGPVFDVNTAKPLGGIHQADFFNLACVDDALAKARFSNPAGDEHDTTVMLRLITADYCGTHMTVRGIKLDWLAPQLAKETPVLEAIWGPDGAALCIGTPRLMTVRTKNKPIKPERLPRPLQPDACKSGRFGKCDRPKWIDELRAQCGIVKPCMALDPQPQGNQISFTSQVGPDGKLHVEKQTPSTSE